VTDLANEGAGATTSSGTELTNAPDNWVEHWRCKYAEGTRKRWLFDKLALPVDPPTEFREGEDALVQAMLPTTGDAAAKAEQAADLLAEAESTYARAEDRAAGATSRATTLQGAVAIATSLLLAGAGLVVDQAKLQGTGWRVALAVLLVAVTVALVMTGLRALSATSTIHRWHRPTPANLVERSQLAPVEARVRLAAETLVDYSYNTKIAAWKVAYLGAAAWWFRIALVLLVVLAGVVGAYAISGGPSKISTSTNTNAPAKQQK
jgi:hypothetical protein